MQNQRNTIVNIRATLLRLPIGESIMLREARGSTLRCTASTLKELGYKFHINRVGEGFKVWREA